MWADRVQKVSSLAVWTGIITSNERPSIIKQTRRPESPVKTGLLITLREIRHRPGLEALQTLKVWLDQCYWCCGAEQNGITQHFRIKFKWCADFESMHLPKGKSLTLSTSTSKRHYWSNYKYLCFSWLHPKKLITHCIICYRHDRKKPTTGRFISLTTEMSP